VFLELTMPKKILVTLPFIVMLASPVLANSVAKSQRMLNQLGYNAGPVDGAYGGKTRGALEKFYADNGSLYDGKLDANEIVDLRSSQASLPDTDVVIEMDSVFKPTNLGIEDPFFMPNNIAWDKSVITGVIANETVYRFQTKYGVQNEGPQDQLDQARYKKSRSEYSIRTAFRQGDVVTTKYAFYVPAEITISGRRTHITGQWKNNKAGVIVYSIQTAPAHDAVPLFRKWYKASKFSNTRVKPHDLIFQYRGILDNNSKNHVSSAITLSPRDVWQGKWNTVEITTNLNDNGSFKFLFNGKTIIDCTGCDAMPNENHDQFYEDDWAFQQQKNDGLMFHFGAYQSAFNPKTIDPSKNQNTVVFMKDIVIKKIN